MIRKVIKSIDFNQISTLNAAKLTWHPNGTFCEVCCVRLKDHYTFLKHVKSTSHAFKSHIIKKYGKSDIFRRYYCAYTCSYCSMVFTNKKTVALHSREVHSVTISRSGLKPDTLVLRKNITSQASNSKRYKIFTKNQKPPVTDEMSSGERLLKEVDTNIKTESRDDVIVKSEGNDDTVISDVNPKRYPCKFCVRSFCFMESLSRHLRKHHPDKHLCVKCGFFSVNSRLYSKHLRSHYNLTRNQRVCSDCFKICNDYAELFAHRKLVHGAIKSSFLCSECRETFVTVVELKEHKRQVHWAPREDVSKTNLRCKKCNRQFASALVLKFHQCTAKKFACLKKCGKRFEFYTQMERHMIKCTKGRTIYTCPNPQCKKTLSCLQTFKNHLTKCSSASNEERKPALAPTPAPTTAVDCNLCNISFQTEDAFEKHYEECHKKLPVNAKPEENLPRKVVSSSGVQNQSDNLKTNKNVVQTVRNLVLVGEKEREKPEIENTAAQKVTSVPVTNAIGNKNYWRCKKCREKYFSIGELESHFVTCRGIQTQHVKCHCGAIFVDKKVLRLHKIVDHQGDKSTISKRSVDKVFNKISKSPPSRENRLQNRSNDVSTSVINDFAPENKQPKPVENPKAEASQERRTTDENSRKNSSLSDETRNYKIVNQSDVKSSPKTIGWKVDNKQRTPTLNNTTCKESTVASTSSIYEPIAAEQYRLGQRLRPDKNIENSPAKQLNTFACSHCGLVFNSEYFLRKHEHDAHKSLVSSNVKATIPAPVSGFYNNHSSHGLSSDVKRPEYQPRPPHDKESSYAARNDEKRQEYQTRLPYDRESSYAARNDEKRQEYQQRLPYDRGMGKSYLKQNYHYNRYHPLHKVDRSNRSHSESEKYDDSYRSRAHRNNKIEPSHSHNATPLGKSAYTGCKSRNQLTITSNVSNVTCEVCRNPNPHLFCTICRTCYRENQVQYINHMKMKHS